MEEAELVENVWQKKDVVTYQGNFLKMFVASLQRDGFGQVLTHATVLGQEDLALVFQPV
jgi:hypothetical protein